MVLYTVTAIVVQTPKAFKHSCVLLIEYTCNKLGLLIWDVVHNYHPSVPLA